MKVLQINAVNKISSTGRTTYELNCFLNDNGNSCVSAFSAGSSVNPENEFVIGSRLDVKLHGLLSRISGKQGYFSVFATKKLLRFMDEYNPDVVVLRNLHGNYINLKCLLKYLAKRNIATVTVLHDCWFYTGKCCHYTVDSCYRWQECCGNCPSLKKYNKSWFFDCTASMLKDKKKLFNSIPNLAVVGVSDWITNEAKKAPVFSSAKIFKRIYNWIDTETFSPKECEAKKEALGISNKKIILCVAGHWSKEKGIDTVLKLADRLDDDERLLLVGNIDSNLFLNDKVLHIKATDSVEELVQYYSLADVLIQPSLEETFGKVSAEALSCGTPVVCYDSTANPELVGNDCGAVVEIGNIDQMLSAVRNILAVGNQEYIEKCRTFAKESFDKEANLNEYLELFKLLLQ